MVQISGSFTLQRIDHIIGLQLFVVTVQPRPSKTLSLHRDLGLVLILLLAITKRLLEVVREIIRIEVILLRIRLLNGARALIIWTWEHN